MRGRRVLVGLGAEVRPGVERATNHDSRERFRDGRELRIDRHDADVVAEETPVGRFPSARRDGRDERDDLAARTKRRLRVEERDRLHVLARAGHSREQAAHAVDARGIGVAVVEKEEPELGQRRAARAHEAEPIGRVEAARRRVVRHVEQGELELRANGRGRGGDQRVPLQPARVLGDERPERAGGVVVARRADARVRIVRGAVRLPGVGDIDVEKSEQPE